MTDSYYRVDGKTYSNYDPETDQCGPSHVEIRVTKFDVLKHTPKGAWVKAPFDAPHFILDGARKKYANPTLSGAYMDFYARKARHISILSARIAVAQRMVAQAKMQAPA